MENFRKKMERFFLRNRNKGIPNLMMYIGIANVAVYLLSIIDPSNVVYALLRFSPAAILKGQVWRLVTYILTYMVDVSTGSFAGPLLGLVSLFCYYQFGRILES